MSVISNIFWGIILIVAGVAMVRYNRQITNSFFRIQAAEKYLGAGGSYMMWLLIGLIAIIAGIIVLFGLGDDIATFILSPITNAFKK